MTHSRPFSFCFRKKTALCRQMRIFLQIVHLVCLRIKQSGQQFEVCAHYLISLRSKYLPKTDHSDITILLETTNNNYTAILLKFMQTNAEKISDRNRIWASSRENLSSGFPTKRVSNQSPQLQRLARKLKFYL